MDVKHEFINNDEGKTLETIMTIDEVVNLEELMRKMIENATRHPEK